jgi:hypothetical protein
MTKATTIASLLLALAGCRMDARRQAVPPDVAAARTFVTDFYAWYYPGSAGMKNIDTLMVTHRGALDPELAAMIDADNACMVRTHGVCNLEEDPVLAAQDPCERYEVGGTLLHHDTVGVSVFAICDGKRDTIPSVIAMVVSSGGTWQFANFIYPAEKTDLRTILSQKSSE